MGCGKSKHAVVAAEPITMKRACGAKFDPKFSKNMVEEIREVPTMENNEKLPLKQESKEVDKICGEECLEDVLEAGGAKVDPKVSEDMVEKIEGAATIEHDLRLPQEQESEEVDKKCEEDVLEVDDLAEDKEVSMEEENEIEQEKGQENEIEEGGNEEDKEGGDIIVVEHPAELPSVDLFKQDLSITSIDEEGASESERSEYSSPHPSEVGKEHSFDEFVKLDEALEKIGLFEATKPTETSQDEPTRIKEEELLEEAKAAEVHVSTLEAEENKD